MVLSKNAKSNHRFCCAQNMNGLIKLLFTMLNLSVSEVVNQDSTF
jgi:hypothetical protein